MSEDVAPSEFISENWSDMWEYMSEYVPDCMSQSKFMPEL